jgi:L-alanine-DL-glutamate epimerase-like enolase superfamily enzyme
LKITNILAGEINIPLAVPFKTALRAVSSINDIVVKIETDTGHCGFGEASPAAVITGDTKASIRSAVLDFIKPAIIGMEIDNLEGVTQRINASLAPQQLR